MHYYWIQILVGVAMMSNQLLKDNRTFAETVCAGIYKFNFISVKTLILVRKALSIFYWWNLPDYFLIQILDPSSSLWFHKTCACSRVHWCPIQNNIAHWAWTVAASFLTAEAVDDSATKLVTGCWVTGTGMGAWGGYVIICWNYDTLNCGYGIMAGGDPAL